MSKGYAPTLEIEKITGPAGKVVALGKITALPEAVMATCCVEFDVEVSVMSTADVVVVPPKRAAVVCTVLSLNVICDPLTVVGMINISLQKKR